MTIGTAKTDYMADFFEWSQGQAQLLRALGAGTRDLPEGLDIDTIAEEIEDLGKAELHAVESQICNILIHLLKAVSQPDAPSLRHWRTETTTFHADLMRRYSPSMRQRIDLAKAWRLAMRIARDALSEHNVKLADGIPADCPFSVEEIVDDGFEFDRSRQQLANRTSSHSSS